MARGELFILSAPSGTGKTTLIRNVLDGGSHAVGNLHFSVSHTTRAPRGREVDGEDYYFVGRGDFRRMIDGGGFLEWAEVHGHLYGTSRDEVLPRLAAGVDVLMDIDVQGAERVLAQHTEAHSVFVLPPSYAVLRERLHRRGLDDEEEIARRLAVSLSEIKRYERYGYVIVNQDAERASEVLASIVLAARQRVPRLREEVEAVVRSFEATDFAASGRAAVEARE
ncbi:MAG TPA: guanylate kinase [Thermoanaerobaculia bacterium]|nr:guanylate kinase [Thermoanaerobaculia bacterium]